MASGPITWWQIDGGEMETVADFIFLGSKITADNDCSHEIKRHLLLRKKAMTNLDSLLKSRDSTLLKKVYLVKAMVFSIVMYGCESWTIKKAECWRIDAFELCSAGEDFWESLEQQGYLTSPWIFIGRTDAEAEAPTFWPPDTKSRLIGKDPDARKDWGQEEKGATEDEMVGWHHQLNGHEFEQTLRDSEGQRKSCVLQSMRSKKVGHNWVTEQQ